MSLYTTQVSHTRNSLGFIDRIDQDALYVFAGNVLPYKDEGTVSFSIPTLGNSIEACWKAKQSTVFLKQLKKENLHLGILNIKWKDGTVYTQWNPSIDNMYEKDQDRNPYYIVSSGSVFICLGNNGDSPSRVEPTFNTVGTTFRTVRLDDGYIWKWLFDIPFELMEKWKTEEILPVPMSESETSQTYKEVKTLIETARKQAFSFTGILDVQLKDGGEFQTYDTNFQSLVQLNVSGDGKDASLSWQYDIIKEEDVQVEEEVTREIINPATGNISYVKEKVISTKKSYVFRLSHLTVKTVGYGYTGAEVDLQYDKSVVIVKLPEIGLVVDYSSRLGSDIINDICARYVIVKFSFTDTEGKSIAFFNDGSKVELENFPVSFKYRQIGLIENVLTTHESISKYDVIRLKNVIKKFFPGSHIEGTVSKATADVIFVRDLDGMCQEIYITNRKGDFFIAKDVTTENSEVIESVVKEDGFVDVVASGEIEKICVSSVDLSSAQVVCMENISPVTRSKAQTETFFLALEF